MDQEFKKIMEKLRGASDKAKAVDSIMQEYQNTLDTMVEHGVMNEHEARMDFFCKTNEVLRMVSVDEEEDDDADDESKDSHVATKEEVADFVKECPLEDLKKYETIGKAIEDFQDALSTVGLKFSGTLRFDNADRCDDRC